MTNSSNMSLIRSMASYLRLHWRDNHNRFHSHSKGLAALEQKRFFSGNKIFESETKGEEIRTSSNINNNLHKWSFSTWAKWAVGSMLALAIPFWQNQWKSLLRLEGEVEMVGDVVENVAEVVEKVATVTENVSSEMADAMPDNAKLKDAVLVLEHVSKEVAQDAHLVQDIIHKMDEVKQDIETVIDSFVDGEKSENEDAIKIHK